VVSNSIGTWLAPALSKNARKHDHAVTSIEEALQLQPPFAPGFTEHGAQLSEAVAPQKHRLALGIRPSSAADGNSRDAARRRTNRARERVEYTRIAGHFAFGLVEPFPAF
jgi:hypothetical protein